MSSVNAPDTPTTHKRKRNAASTRSPHAAKEPEPAVPAISTTAAPITTEGEDADAEHSLPTKRARRNAADNNNETDSGEERVQSSVLPPAELAAMCPSGYSMNPPPTDRPVRVYADGVFDLFHLGFAHRLTPSSHASADGRFASHMRQLEQAKKAFPNTYLLVGLPSDAETHKYKGLTVLTDKERAESLRHCKWVDEVIEDAPWSVTPDFLDLHRIDYVAHDDEPYVSVDSDDIYKPCKEAGRFMVTQRTEGISTTYIITKYGHFYRLSACAEADVCLFFCDRIVRDYEKYVSRQLKRGASRQELNLSWLKKNEMDIKRHVSELRETIKNNWSTTGFEACLGAPGAASWGY